MPFAIYSSFSDCVRKNQDKNNPEAFCASIKRKVEGKSYSFLTDQIAYEIVETKAGKRYFVTGYISTGDIDLYDDLVTEKGLKSMLKQIKETDIMLDYEHEAWRDDPTILPVGKIVEAKMDERGLWVKAELNQASPKFKDMWDSMKQGFLKAFSIAFKPLKTVEKVLKDATVRLIDDLILLNVAITGTPINQNAVITNFSMKNIFLKAIEENLEGTMADEIKPEDAPNVEEEKKEEVKKDGKKEEPKKEETAEEKKPEPEAKAEKPKENVEIKAMKKELETLKAEIKEMKEKAVFKSEAPKEPEQKTEKLVDGFSMIR